jgi:transglutaminase-like putative cysteine protease
MNASRTSRRQLAPEEGWASVALVAVMAVTMAWSIDDAGWVLGRSEWTDFLPGAALLGVAVGFIGAKTGWSRWVAHAIGATFAALIVPIMVGEVLPNGGTTFGSQFVATADQTVKAWNDLIINGQPATRATGHHLLVLGGLCWGTGQFAASAVFRHRQPLSAVVVIGAFLIGNMAATVREQLGYLILFSLASLFLLIRLHALDEQATWMRRRIGDPAAVRSIYLRGGTVFILIAVVGSLVLTASARSAPLAGAWEDVKPVLLDISAAIQRFLPAGGDNRGFGAIQFGSTAVVQTAWSTNSDLSLTIKRPTGDKRPYYWRVIAYDRADLYGWGWTGADRLQRPAGEELLAGSLDAPPAEGGVEVSFTVTPAAYRGSYVLSPLTPVRIDRNSDVLALGEGNLFEAIEINGREPYVVTARIPLLGDDPPGALTQNQLRVAGDDYPDEILASYLQVPEGAIGPLAQKVLDDVLARTPEMNPFDIATTMVNELQSRRFDYVTNVADVDCGDRSVAECFAFSRRGFCQQYATLMTILLREQGIPARYVQGFLPGNVNPLTGIEEIPNSNGHAWVEVYFPRYGWVIFDPTGGNRSQVEALPIGQRVDGPSPRPSQSRSPADDGGPDTPPRTPNTGGPAGIIDQGGGPGPFILVALLLLAAVGGVGFAAWQRGPRGPTTPDGAYDGVTRLAARLGFGPKPTQTAYEYAAALGDVLPNIRPELQTVATAKVEVAYGRRTLGAERIRALRASYRRLRVGLLRLLFRRFRRGGRRSSL